MERSTASPVTGFVLVARVAEDASERGRWRAHIARVVALLTAIAGVSLFGVVLAAAVQGTLIYLIPLVLVAALLGCQACRSSSALAFSRDEATVTMLDRLREYAPPSELGVLAPQSGALAWLKPGGVRVAWLTDRGIFLSTGQRVPWSAFTSHAIERAGRGVVRLRLRRGCERVPGRSSAALRRHALPGAACLIALGSGIVGLQHLGPRTDVLACLFCGTALLGGMLLELLMGAASRGGAAPVEALDLLLDTSQTPTEEVECILLRNMAA